MIDSYNDIYDMIEDRLNKTGEIRTVEVYNMCKGRYSYSIVQSRFREIMDTMVEQRKAVMVRAGLWNILKPNLSIKA